MRNFLQSITPQWEFTDGGMWLFGLRGDVGYDDDGNAYDFLFLGVGFGYFYWIV